jgi:hypothetical protein
MTLRLLAASVALVGVSACAATPPPEKSAVEFQSEDGITSASWGKTPKGTRLETCPLYKNKTRLTIVLAVPNRFRLQSADGSGCSFGHDWHSVGVSGNAPTLRRRMEKNLKPYEDIGGDDSVSDIRYESDVPAFGGRRGERLAHDCFCDGQELVDMAYRTAGVIVGESRSHLQGPLPKSVLPRVLPSVSVERGIFGFATSGGASVRYGTVPLGVGYLSTLDDGIQFDFQKNYRRIELHIDVRGTLANERTRLSRDKAVSKLVLSDTSKAVAGHDGQRLTYDQAIEEYEGSTRVEHAVVLQAGTIRVAVINDPTADHQQAFRDQLRLIR